MDRHGSKTKDLTRGGQIIFNNLRMLGQVVAKINRWFFYTVVGMALVILICSVSFDVWQATYYYVASKILSHTWWADHVFHYTWHSEPVVVDVAGVLAEPYFSQQVSLLLDKLVDALIISSAVGFVGMIIGTKVLERRGRKQGEKRFVRGARLAGPKEFSKEVKEHGASDIKIASVPMVSQFEVKHALIHGTTGSGKGQIFCQLIEQIKARGDSAIIFDKGCVFTSIFYNPDTDVVLNPFDERCVQWDLWSEARSDTDFDNIAKSLIPLHGETDQYWVKAARTVFSSVAYRMRNDPDRSIKKLLSLILTAELDVLGDYLKGSEAATLVSGKIEKTAISIRSVISTYLKSLRFLIGLEERPKFAIRDWIKGVADSNEANFLFIPSNAAQHESLTPLISMWLSMASLSLLSLEESHDRRIWFICDELPSLQKLPFLRPAVTEGRKFGVCAALGMQSFAQLETVYSRSGAKEVFDSLNTRFFLRSPSADMAAMVSKEIGQEDVELSSESYSYGANTVRDGISIGTNRVTRALVSPAEVMEMPDLRAYLRVPAPVPVAKIDLPFIKRKRVAPSFLPREIPDMSNYEVKPPKEGGTNESNAEDGASDDERKVSAKPEEIADSSKPSAELVVGEEKIKDKPGQDDPKKETIQDRKGQEDWLREEANISDSKDDREYDTFV